MTNEQASLLLALVGRSLDAAVDRLENNIEMAIADMPETDLPLVFRERRSQPIFFPTSGEHSKTRLSVLDDLRQEVGMIFEDAKNLRQEP